MLKSLRVIKSSSVFSQEQHESWEFKNQVSFSGDLKNGYIQM